MNETNPPSKSPLTIRRIMIWTFGVAVALTATKLVGESSTNAWNLVAPNQPRTSSLTPSDYVTAFVYGTFLSLFLIAIGTKHFWQSPGKILFMIFALICILDWGITLIVNALIAQNVTVTQLPPFPVTGEIRFVSKSTSSLVTANGYIFGHFYANIAGKIGYLVGIPVLLFTLFRSREDSKIWKLVWLGFLFFVIAMLFEFYGWRQKLTAFPPWFQRLYFPSVIGVPITTMLIALTSDWIRKIKIDWWTLVASSLLAVAWVALVVITLTT